MLYKVFLSILILYFFFSQINRAQGNDELSILDLGEIVVTPTKTEREIGEVSSSVSIVSRQDIEESTAHSATDVLNILPGVFVHKTGSFGRADVVIRGQGSQGRRVMVMVDGKPEKMALFGCTITHSLPLDAVDRIEVIRGASSVLYGSDAIGGVVNIITKKATRKSQGDVMVSYGSYDTQSYRLRQGGIFERTNYYFTYDKKNSRGHLPNSDYHHDTAAIRIAQRFTPDMEMTLSSRYFDGFKREPEPSPPDTWNRYQRGHFDLTFDTMFLGGTQMCKLYRNFGHHRLSDNWHSKDYMMGTMLHSQFELFEDNTFLAGFEYREDSGKVYSGGIPGKYRKNEYAFFSHDEQKLWDERVILNGGLRYNEDSFAGRIVVPALGCVWRITQKTSLRTSMERGFRTPQLNELQFFATSNPELKPEKSWNYEWGISHHFTPGTVVDCVYFITKAEDFIAVRAGHFQNIDRLEFKGVEMSCESILSEVFRLKASYTYLDSGYYTTGRPEHELDFSLLYKREKATLSLTAQGVDNYFAADNRQNAIPNFMVVDAKLSYDLSASVKVYLQIDNLFNSEHKRYVDLPAVTAGVYTQPPRSIFLSCLYKW